MSLVAIKFQDPDYNGGAVSDGFLDTATGNLIEPGNTNGNFVDPMGWLLAKYQAGKAVLSAEIAGLVRGDCAATGITPASFWEYVGKPLVIMATAVVGGAAISTAGAGAGAGAAAGAGATLAPTTIAAPTFVGTLAAPISTAGVGTVSASLGTVGAIGAGGAAASTGIGGALLTGAEQIGTKVVLGTALSKLAPKPAAPPSIDLAPVAVTRKAPPWGLIVLAGAAGLLAVIGGIA